MPIVYIPLPPPVNSDSQKQPLWQPRRAEKGHDASDRGGLTRLLEHVCVTEFPPEFLNPKVEKRPKRGPEIIDVLLGGLGWGGRHKGGGKGGSRVRVSEYCAELDVS